MSSDVFRLDNLKLCQLNIAIEVVGRASLLQQTKIGISGVSSTLNHCCWYPRFTENSAQTISNRLANAEFDQEDLMLDQFWPRYTDVHMFVGVIH